MLTQVLSFVLKLIFIITAIYYFLQAGYVQNTDRCKNEKSKIENQKSKICRRFCHSGFTIAELLIALMITGMLLAAIAVAFNASVKNFNDNREIFYAVNKARQALTQIVPRLRTGHCFNTLSPANECAFYDAGETSITYSYDSSDKKLYMIELTAATSFAIMLEQ